MRSPFIGLCLGVALLAGPALAQEGQEPEKKTTEEDLRRNGPYLGVSPGLRDVAPGKAEVNSQGAIRLLTWVGFQMVGAGGRVFLQASERPIYNLVPGAPDEVILELPDTKLHMRNDGRRLETGAFPSAVIWIDAEQIPGTITRVTVKLRETVGYDLRQEGNYVLLDFRPPSPASLTPQLPVPAAEQPR